MYRIAANYTIFSREKIKTAYQYKPIGHDLKIANFE